MTDDPREIVSRGYDAAARHYQDWLATSVIDTSREKYLAKLCGLLPPGSKVLELGCGGGGPTTQELAQRFTVVGVDISARQVELARQRVPTATFEQADMTAIAYPAATFSGIAAFYSLIHLPYGELPSMLSSIGEWLTPGGVLLASLAARGAGEHLEPDWLGGVPMYWSAYSLEETLQLVEDAGLAMIEANVETNREDGEEAPFLWVLCRKPEHGEGS